MPASAQPTACRHCVPVGLDCETMLSVLWPQCDGICRPPLFGSSLAPTADRNISSGVMPSVEAQRAVAIVREEPVVAGLQRQAGGHHDGFVAGAADLEKDQALVLELDFLVVDPARQQHGAVDVEHLVARHFAPAFAAAMRWRQRRPWALRRCPCGCGHSLADVDFIGLDYTPVKRDDSRACGASAGTKSPSTK